MCDGYNCHSSVKYYASSRATSRHPACMHLQRREVVSVPRSESDPRYRATHSQTRNATRRKYQYQTSDIALKTKWISLQCDRSVQTRRGAIHVAWTAHGAVSAIMYYGFPQRFGCSDGRASILRGGDASDISGLTRKSIDASSIVLSENTRSRWLTSGNGDAQVRTISTCTISRYRDIEISMVDVRSRMRSIRCALLASRTRAEFWSCLCGSRAIYCRFNWLFYRAFDNRIARNDFRGICMWMRGVRSVFCVCFSRV